MPWKKPPARQLSQRPIIVRPLAGAQFAAARLGAEPERCIYPGSNEQYRGKDEPDDPADRAEAGHLGAACEEDGEDDSNRAIGIADVVLHDLHSIAIHMDPVLKG